MLTRIKDIIIRMRCYFFGHKMLDRSIIAYSIIEVFEVLPDGSMQVEVRGFDFDKPMREQYTTVGKDKLDYWEKHPDKAPWGFWTDTEAYCQAANKKSRWFRDKN